MLNGYLMFYAQSLTKVIISGRNNMYAWPAHLTCNCISRVYTVGRLARERTSVSGNLVLPLDSQYLSQTGLVEVIELSGVSAIHSSGFTCVVAVAARAQRCPKQMKCDLTRLTCKLKIAVVSAVCAEVNGLVYLNSTL